MTFLRFFDFSSSTNLIIQHDKIDILNDNNIIKINHLIDLRTEQLTQENKELKKCVKELWDSNQELKNSN